jgi:hypothetical protein
MKFNIELENCETEATFFGWYYNECKKSNYDLHWKDAMELEVPAKYAEQIEIAVAYHVYAAWSDRGSTPETRAVVTSSTHDSSLRS